MKKATLLVAFALFSATLTAFTQFVSAAEEQGKLPTAIEGATPATSVAGITKQEDPQPKTKALLTKDANRNIRWQPWEYRNAFSASVLEQLQKGINDGTIPLGEICIYESDTIEAAVKEGAKKGIQVLEDARRTKKLDLSKGKDFKLAVYTYRHNYADAGVFQFYVSGTVTFYENSPPNKQYPFKDIQAIQYEFDDPDYTTAAPPEVTTTITLWRGAVVRVNAEGIVTNTAGSIAGVKVGTFVEEKDNDGKPITKWVAAEVNAVPFADWELASVLPREAYDPAKAVDRPDYVHPADRIEKVEKLADEAGLGVQPGIKPVPNVYQYNGPRSSYRYSRFLFRNGR
ncbi:MAG: hypothetical protein LBE18_06125 [Planctomycetaceae bacterium]|jgi:hypothetical protein|nr:hypothetical protein [Planctomycetaceae bacterium]